MSDWVYGGSEIDNGDFEGPRRNPWSLARMEALGQRLVAAFPDAVQAVQFNCRQCGPVSLPQATQSSVIVPDDLARAHIRGHQERN